MDNYTLADLLANKVELQQAFGQLIPTLVLEEEEEESEDA
jgi:Rrf2 family nitric oxide-sensitive transcriptional repressor